MTTMESIGLGILIIATVGFAIWVAWLAFRD